MLSRGIGSLLLSNLKSRYRCLSLSLLHLSLLFFHSRCQYHPLHYTALYCTVLYRTDCVVVIYLQFGVLTVFGSRIQQNNLSSTSTSTSPAAIINGGVVENSFLIVFINTVFSLLSGISAMAVIGYTTQEIDKNFRPNTTGPAFLVRIVAVVVEAVVICYGSVSVPLLDT